MKDTENWQPTAARALLEARAEALASVRQFFAERQVLEVQTPLLGGATVTDPFIDAFTVVSNGIGVPNVSLPNASLPNVRLPNAGLPNVRLQDNEGTSIETVGFLQTSTEYHQKRLLAAGVGDNYTLGPVFRSDERGRLHNPEFTMLEWYRVGFDDRQLMAELCDLINRLLGPDDFQTHDYATLVGEQRSDAAEDHADLKLARALEALGEGRHFVVGYPAASAVLARLDPHNPQIARRFELVINGVEVANGYFELTDADAHRDRFAADNQRRQQLGLSEVAVDEALLEAVRAGLPDCAGVAVGFDRLLMLRHGCSSIEEVQAFGWSRR